MENPQLPSGHSYLIQKHDATRLHYDLRLELDGLLRTWTYNFRRENWVRSSDHPTTLREKASRTTAK